MKVLKWVGIGILSFLLFVFLLPFGALFTVHQTVLNPAFVNAHIETLDLSSVARDMLQDTMGQELSRDMTGVNPDFTDQLIGNVITALEPWAREQAQRLVNTGYDYILGNSDRFALDIPLDPVKTTIRDEAWALFQASPPKEAAGLTSAQLRALFEQEYARYSAGMPASILIDESVMDAGMRDSLNQAREIVSYLRTAYFVCIGLMIVFLAGLVLITRQVRLGMRVIGAVLLAAGVIQLVETVTLTSFVLPAIEVPESVGEPLAVWIKDLVNDVFSPLKWLSIGFVAGGVALIIASFFYRPQRKAPVAAPLPPAPPPAPAA